MNENQKKENKVGWVAGGVIIGALAGIITSNSLATEKIIYKDRPVPGREVVKEVIVEKPIEVTKVVTKMIEREATPHPVQCAAYPLEAMEKFK